MRGVERGTSSADERHAQYEEERDDPSVRRGPTRRSRARRIVSECSPEKRGQAHEHRTDESGDETPEEVLEVVAGVQYGRREVGRVEEHIDVSRSRGFPHRTNLRCEMTGVHFSGGGNLELTPAVIVPQVKSRCVHRFALITSGIARDSSCDNLGLHPVPRPQRRDALDSAPNRHGQEHKPDDAEQRRHPARRDVRETDAQAHCRTRVMAAPAR